MAHTKVVSRKILSGLNRKTSLSKGYSKGICFSRGLESWIDVTIVPSLLFLVSQFCTPLEVKFDAFVTSKSRGRKIAIEKISLLHLSAHWGDLIEQIKKKSVIYTLTKKCMASGRCIGQPPDGHTFLCKFWHFQTAVSCLRLGLFTPNLGTVKLGLHFMAMSINIC